MAKTVKSVPVSTDTAEVTIPYGMALEAHSFQAYPANLPMASIVYLLSNGYSQSLTDAGTTAAARAKDAAVKEAEKTRGKMGKAEVDAFLSSDAIKGILDEAAFDARKKRLEALEAGTMIYGARGPNGPRRSPLDQFLYDCAEADATKDARAQGKVLPKDKDSLLAILDRYIAVRRDAYSARFIEPNVGDVASLLGDI